MAAYPLTRVRDYVRGCGGMSVYLLLRNDGRIGTVTSHHSGQCGLMDQHAKDFNLMQRALLLVLASPEAADADFEHYLTEVFKSRMIAARRDWTAALKKREAEFATSNPQLSAAEARILSTEVRSTTLL